MDTFIPDTLRFFVRMCGQAVSTMIFIVVIMPIFAAPLIPIMILYLIIATFYRATAREIKRMESVSRSPMYALFGETLAGLATIRAFKKNAVFLKLAEAKLDLNNTYW
jgi:ABC-type multidrug transport system fused ATPase/permease subunit